MKFWSGDGTPWCQGNRSTDKRKIWNGYVDLCYIFQKVLLYLFQWLWQIFLIIRYHFCHVFWVSTLPHLHAHIKFLFVHLFKFDQPLFMILCQIFHHFDFSLYVHYSIRQLWHNMKIFIKNIYKLEIFLGHFCSLLTITSLRKDVTV